MNFIPFYQYDLFYLTKNLTMTVDPLKFATNMSSTC